MLYYPTQGFITEGESNYGVDHMRLSRVDLRRKRKFDPVIRARSRCGPQEPQWDLTHSRPLVIPSLEYGQFHFHSGRGWPISPRKKQVHLRASDCIGS